MINNNYQENNPSVLISIPVPPATGKIVPGLVKFLLFSTHIRGYKVGVDIVEGKPIDHVRNLAVKRFLDTDFDYMLCVDSDIEPPNSTLPILLGHKKDVIGAMCLSYQFGAPFSVVMTKVNGGYRQSAEINNGKRLIECEATGAACLMIHRDILKRVHPGFKTLYRDDGTLSWGQDFQMCERIRELGYKIWIDTHLLCGHLTVLDIKQINELLINEKVKTIKEAINNNNLEEMLTQWQG